MRWFLRYESFDFMENRNPWHPVDIDLGANVMTTEVVAEARKAWNEVKHKRIRGWGNDRVLPRNPIIFAKL